METRTDLPATLLRERLEFTYDYQGRRVRKQAFQWDNVAEEFTPAADTWYIYHGWKLLAEGTIQNSELIIQKSHLWGHDLTGTFEGAGTVGGLLATTTHGSGGATWFMAYDGKGNIAAAINGTTGEREARFHYGPSGETLTAEGSAVEHLPHRFSTKYTDQETGLLYYGYRYLNPETGRWLNRDPIEEEGGINLYGFVGNNGVERIDVLGLATVIVDGKVSSASDPYCCYNEAGDFIQPVKDDFGKYCCREFIKHISITWEPTMLRMWNSEWGHVAITLPSNPDFKGGRWAGATFGFYPYEAYSLVSLLAERHVQGKVLYETPLSNESKCRACPATVVALHDKVNLDISNPPTYHWSSNAPSKNCKTWVMDVLDSVGGTDCSNTVMMIPVIPYVR